MDSFSSLRRLFPAADKWSYLDHAAVGTLCLPVHKAVSGYIDDASRNGRVNHAHWEQTTEETRNRCAALLECSPTEIALTDLLESGLRKKGMEILSPRGEGEKSGIVTFRYPGEERDYEAICVEIEKRGAVVSARGGGIRVSPHFYNNEDDVGLFLEALP